MMTARLLDSYADWRGPCKTQDPILDGLEGNYETVEFVKVDVDGEQDVVNRYQARSLPMLIVENDDDSIVDRFVGVIQCDDIEPALSQASA